MVTSRNLHREFLVFRDEVLEARRGFSFFETPIF